MKTSLTIIAVAVLASTPALAASETGNFVENGDFEDAAKASAWVLTSGKGVKGGDIIQEEDGNHVLCAQGDTYWVASINYRYFRELHIERFAGQRLRASFRVKGDEDAYPGASFVYVAGGKRIYKTLLWKSPYPEHQSMRPTQEFRRYERVIELPSDTTEVLAISLYNCNRRGRLCFDDVALEVVREDPGAEAPAKAATSSASAWDAVELTDRELIELSNTYNYLVVQWAHMYGTLLDVERSSYYGGCFRDLDAGLKGETEGLRSRVVELRRTLVQLQAFYINTDFRRGL